MSVTKHIDLETLGDVITAIPSNIFFKDTDCKYVFSSHIWEQVENNGDEDFDIYGKSDRDVRKDVENIDALEAADRKIIETGVGTRYTIKTEVDDHLQFLELTKEPVRDKDGNILGIVGLINDVTAVTQELSDMLENEKAYQEAMKAGALLAYNINLSKDLLLDDLNEEIDGQVVNLLELMGLKAPCSYTEMVERYMEVLLHDESKEEYYKFHNVQMFIDMFNQGRREITKESKLYVKGLDGNPVELWAFETVLLMQNRQKEIMAFVTVNDITEARKKEEQIRIQLEENVKEAERVAAMKSDFLANMSHEIRTPMNAVIGLAEMALREDLPDTAKDYINQIKTSGSALLGIINDILDFSKIESGKMDIIPDDYEPLSCIHDVTSVVMTRIGDKDLEMVGHVNPNLPIGLYGDSMRIRQVVINLANNAVKFTNEGYVCMDVDFEKTGEDTGNLIVSVKDTGIGIKEEDLNKLFVSFQQVDSKRNRNIEGTGLGLAICAQLVDLMGGTISVTSEYGKGSCFSFSVPQKVTDWTPSLKVRDAQDKLVIGYIENSSVTGIFYDILDSIEVENYRFDEVGQAKDAHADSFENKKIHFITDQRIYTEKLGTYVDAHPEIQFIVLCDFRATSPNEQKPNVSFIKKPISTIGLSMALNNEQFHAMDAEAVEFDFVAPDAKVLIVDDNEVNLVVAEGLLEPLKMQVKTALSGKKALELIEQEKFDLVFMDHMMPEMDGVETTRNIREKHPELDSMPVIALSANAVGNAREMFLSEGMNDFVAKPIELRTITNKIRQWLPKEKIQKSMGEENAGQANEPEEKLVIGDLDIDAAVSLIGNQKLYLTILEKYFSAIKPKSEVIRNCEATGDIKTYTIEVHALKSSSKQIGAMELSAMAAELEACGNANDTETIHAKTGALLDRYLGYYDTLNEVFGSDEEEGDKPSIDPDKLSEYLDKMLAASDELDMDAMEEIANEMNKYSYEGEAAELMTSLKEAAENIDVDSIGEIVAKWKNL